MIVINQRFGIGDIIFSMKAIRTKFGRALWPVLPEYVTGLTRAYPDMIFMDYNLLSIDYKKIYRYQISDIDVIPLCHQDIPLIDCMKNKYIYLEMDWHDWKIQNSWKRDRVREFLLLDHLDIKEGEKFNLVNINWGCQSPQGLKPGTSQADFKVDNGLRNINLDIIPGFSLFDWATVIERAEYIYTVSTSLLYLLELLHTSAKEIHLYPRKPREMDFRNVDYLFSKPYILHS